MTDLGLSSIGHWTFVCCVSYQPTGLAEDTLGLRTPCIEGWGAVSYPRGCRMLQRCNPCRIVGSWCGYTGATLRLRLPIFFVPCWDRQ